MKKVLKFILIPVLLITGIFFFHSKSFLKPKNIAPKNVILLIGDGMGKNHIKAGEYLNGEKFDFQSLPNGLVEDLTMFFETTDSAAAGTAMATGIKTNPKKVAKNIFGKSKKTILEIKKSLGKSTGLVTNTPITDATPAVFASHSNNRRNAKEILNGFLMTKPTLIMGGGDPNLDDQMKLTFRKNNFDVIDTYEDFKNFVYREKPLLVTFKDRALPFFDEEQYAPSLKEMAMKSIDILSQNQKGFFLMVEGGIIDEASHALEKDRTVHEVKNFADTVDAVLDWAKNNGDTMIIITADHETTGIENLVNKGKGNVPEFDWVNDGSHTKKFVPIYIYNGNYDIDGKLIKNISIFKLMK